jgi:hypothetical protein
MSDIISDRHRANEREGGSPQSVNGHAITRLDCIGYLRRKIRRGLNFGTIFQNHTVNIAPRSERQAFNFAADRWKLLRVIDGGAYI